MEKFHEDLKVSVDNCHVCHCLIFSDKTKSISSAVLAETCFPSDQHNTANLVVSSVILKYKNISGHLGHGVMICCLMTFPLN